MVIASEDVRHSTPAVNGSRIRLARESRKLTQSDLVARTGDALTVASLSLIENKQTRPTTSTVSTLASALDFPAAFFARRGEPQSGFFRSLRSVSAATRRQALAQAHLVHDLVAALERHVDLPDDEISELRPNAHQSPEQAASVLRELLDQDIGAPIRDVIRKLERHGAVTARPVPVLRTRAG